MRQSRRLLKSRRKQVSAKRRAGPFEERPVPALPLPASQLIGREPESAEISALLLRDDVRLVTLTGAPGVGKTRLSIDIGTGIQSHFPDGVVFVDLAPINDPGLVIYRIAKTFQLPESTRQPIATLLEGYLTKKHLLLVLDNFEHLITAAADVSHLLRDCPGLKVLATSRERLHITWEREVQVQPLPLPDLDAQLTADALAASPAVALFVARAQAVQREFALSDDNASAVAEICVRFDGLPLAIELAAARIKYLRPAEILQGELQRGLMLLATELQDQPARHRTLQVAIAWSHNLLTSTEKVLFRRLVVFSGGATLEAVDVICNPGGELGHSTVDLIASLLNKSLIVKSSADAKSARYTMLVTIHEFAHHRLQSSGEKEDIETRHLAYFLELAETAEDHLHGPQARAWTDRIEGELNNFRRAVKFGLTNADVTNDALRMIVSLQFFLSRRGYWSDAEAWLEAGLPHAAAPYLRGRILMDLGNIRITQREWERAEPFHREAVALLEKTGDLKHTGRALHCLAIAEMTASRYAEARTHLAECIRLAQESGDVFGAAASLDRLGGIELAEGNHAEAWRLLEQSLSIRRAHGNDAGAAHSLIMLGEVARTIGDYGQAKLLYEESLTLNTETQHKRIHGSSLGNLGFVYARLGHKARALSAFLKCLTIGREFNSPGIPGALLGLGIVQPDLERTVRLLAFEQRTRNPWDFTPADQREIDDATTRARRNLSEEKFAKAWDRGSKMTLDEAIRDALSPFETRKARTKEKRSSKLLSHREQTVASLVAQGHTNREIGQALVVGERTAEYHVQSILNKLGFNSRAQIAAWAVAQGIVAAAPSPQASQPHSVHSHRSRP